MENLKYVTEVDDPFGKKGDPFGNKKDDPFKKEKDDPFKKEKEKKSEDEKKKSEEVTQKDSFPIDSIEKSNTFRTYLEDREPGWVSSQGQKFKSTINNTKDIVDDVVKDGWKQFGNDFIKFLQTRSDALLVSMGVELNKDNEKFKMSDAGREMAPDLLKKELQLEKKKCDPWTTNNLIEKKYNDDIERNRITIGFIEWCKKNGFIDTFITTDDFCGFNKFDIDWVYSDWTKDGTTYENYRHPIVKLLSQVKSIIYDDLTNERTRGTLFDRFLKESGQIEKTKDGKFKKETTVDLDNLENIPSAAGDWSELILLSSANRQLCTGLRDSLKSNYSITKEIQTAINRCNSKNRNWLDTSLEGRVKSKLGIFKEGRMIQEKITNKLKSKKNLKSLKENFEKQNYRKFFDTLSSIQKNNTINEATNDEFEKSFDVIFKGKETEFKNRAIEYILNKLGVSQTSEMGKNIKSELDKIPAKDMFKNEYDVPEAVTTAVEKSANTEMSEEQGLKSIVSKAIKFDDKQIKQGVRQHLQDYVEGVKTDIKSLEEKLKKSIIEK